MKTIDRRTMLKFQGDRVLVVIDKDQLIFSFVVFVDGDRRELQLASRESKTRENLPVSCAVLENLKAINDKRAKWKLVL